MAILDINQIRAILPHRYPFLLVDRIVEMEADQQKWVAMGQNGPNLVDVQNCHGSSYYRMMRERG
jgi:3-hydroxymyristoyl/3-hydroxydecanoyl-(acyl carrier protein) dehydratase